MAPGENPLKNAPDRSSDSPSEKSGPNLLRIVLFVILGMVLVLACFEWAARRKAEAVYNRIIAVLEVGELIDQDTIHAWMGREPDATTDVDETTKMFEERYEFGPLRRRTVRVDYIRRAATLVHAVAME